MKYLKDKIKFNKSKKFGQLPCKKKSYLKRFLVHQFKKKTFQLKNMLTLVFLNTI